MGEGAADAARPPPARPFDLPCCAGFEAPARAGGRPRSRARVRARPEDFEVEEVLGYGLAGEGQHVWLRVRKTGLNTEWVAGRLAAVAGVRRREVGFAGLKDRQARAVQWFSVDLAGRPEPDWRALEGEGLELLEVRRHRRKLRRGALAGNRFRLRLTDCEGDRPAIEGALERIARAGVPNYFGPQRFGRAGANLLGAWSMLVGGEPVRDRHRRGLYLSAARSLLFNRVLSRRVAEGSWARALPGEAVMLDGSRSLFTADAPDAVLEARLAALDVHPSGPLWGRGASPARGEAAALEREALVGCAPWRDGLERAGLEHARRATRVRVRGLEWRFGSGDTLELAFDLPAGSYATSVVREILVIRDS